MKSNGTQMKKDCWSSAVFSLWELVITGNAGNAHPDSGLNMKLHCEHCGLTRYAPIKKGIGIIVD
jgi:hypothetical protein